MTHPNLTLFVYHEKLNASFLEELFGTDYPYAATVFEDVVKDLDGQWQELDEAYRHKNVQQIRAAAHKCKTLYAYTGFASLQLRLQTVEQLCGASTFFSPELQAQMDELYEAHPAALLVLKDEIQRLKDFV